MNVDASPACPPLVTQCLQNKNAPFPLPQTLIHRPWPITILMMMITGDQAAAGKGKGIWEKENTRGSHIHAMLHDTFSSVSIPSSSTSCRTCRRHKFFPARVGRPKRLHLFFFFFSFFSTSCVNRTPSTCAFPPPGSPSLLVPPVTRPRDCSADRSMMCVVPATDVD